MSSPSKTIKIDNAREKIEECCGSIQVNFHATWTPVIAGVQFHKKSDTFVMANTNWNPTYNVDGCVEMCHNYGDSKIRLLKENTHMRDARKDMVAFMLPIETPGESTRRNCVALRDLMGRDSGRVGTGGKNNSLLPLTPVDASKDWGEIYIAGMKDMLLLDLTKDDNQDRVADFYGCKQEWDNMKRNFESDYDTYPNSMRSEGEVVLITHRLKQFYQMIQKSNYKKKWMASSIEGKHGFVGISSLLIGKLFNAKTGEASMVDELTYELLKKHNLVNDTAIKSMTGTLIREIDNMLSGRKNRVHMFEDTCSIKLYYLKEPIEEKSEITAEEVLGYCRAVSEAISDAKIGSNRAFPTDTIADYAKTLCVDMKPGALVYRPNFSGQDWPATCSYRSPKHLQDEHGKTVNKEEMAKKYKFPDWHNAKEMMELIKNPGCARAEENWRKFWMRPSKEDENVTMVPPYVNTLTSVMLDCGKKKTNAITTSKINQMYFSIKVMWWMYSAFEKITLDEAIKNQTRIELTEIMVYFYTTPHFSVEYNQLPMSIDIWYPDCFSGNRFFDQASKSIIISCRLFTTMLDVAMVHPGELTKKKVISARGKYTIKPGAAKAKINERLEAVSIGLRIVSQQCRDSMENLIYNTSKYH